jgi:hypothetical protein
MNCIYEIVPVDDMAVEQATAADWIVSDTVDQALRYYRVNQYCGRELQNWESFEEEALMIRAFYNNPDMMFVYCDGITREIIRFNYK